MTPSPKSASSSSDSGDIKRAQKQLKVLDDLIDDLTKAGATIPASLTDSVKTLRIVLDTGGDLGDATATAAAALARYTNKVNEACGDDADYICLARDFHYYQARSVDYTLNWNNDNSVVRNFVRSTLQRYVPQRICDQLDLCKPRK